MGKLNIAHHKSYHPYRADNIARVKQDEEEARLKEALEDGRVSLAVCILIPCLLVHSTKRLSSNTIGLGSPYIPSS